MKRINNISYADKNGFRGLGDLFLPDNQEGAPVALVIHGGSWNAMDKTSITPLAILIAECGYAVFNINYRLLDDAPWPACGDDCIAAANFLLQAVHPVIKQLDHSKIVVAGASAGGHLALWTGLHLPPENVRAIISIAGPADLNYQSKNQVMQAEKWKKFFGTDEVTYEMLASASPANYVKPGAPPLLCIHSTNDKLVEIKHSEMMIEKYRKIGSRAEPAFFEGKGPYHGIWEDGHGEVATDKRVLVSQVRIAIREFLKTL